MSNSFKISPNVIQLLSLSEDVVMVLEPCWACNNIQQFQSSPHVHVIECIVCKGTGKAWVAHQRLMKQEMEDIDE